VVTVVVVVMTVVVIGVTPPVVTRGTRDHRRRAPAPRARFRELGSDDDRAGDAEGGQDSEAMLREHA
jgi:hypothetical protein